MPESSEDAKLSQLPNIGPVSEAWLNEIGLFTRADLRQVGAVMAYKILKHQRPEVNLNLLYALHGALTDTPWYGLSDEAKSRLRREAAGPLSVSTGE